MMIRKTSHYSESDEILQQTWEKDASPRPPLEYEHTSLTLRRAITIYNGVYKILVRAKRTGKTWCLCEMYPQDYLRLVYFLREELGEEHLVRLQKEISEGYIFNFGFSGRSWIWLRSIVEEKDMEWGWVRVNERQPRYPCSLFLKSLYHYLFISTPRKKTSLDTYRRQLTRCRQKFLPRKRGTLYKWYIPKSRVL